MRGREGGFTLIEVMITVVIIGILASIAYPLYSGYVEQARRTDGQAGLMEAAQQLERCYTVNSSYADCSYSSKSPNENYNIIRTENSDSATTYTLSATYVGSGDDGCKSNLILDHVGEKEPDDCW